MKTSFTKSGLGIAFASAMLLTGTLLFQQTQAQTGVGINPSGNPAHASAGLDVDYSDKGLLIPRVGLTYSGDVSTIPSPATSLLVYNTATSGDVTPGFYYWDGSAWTRVQTGSGGGGGGGSDWTTVSNDTWLTNTSGHVGIGTNSPSSSYDLTLQGGYGGGFLVRGSTTNSKFEGNVGIGFSTSSSYELDVDGAVRFQDYVAIGTTPSSTYDLRVAGSAYLDNLRIGTSSSPPSSGLRVSGQIITNTTSGFTGYSTSNTSGTQCVLSSGTLRTTSSSIRYKENIKDLKFNKEKVLSIRPVSFNYKESGSFNVGVIAEEVEQLIPELVIYDRIPIYDENGEKKRDEFGNLMFKDEWWPESVNYDGIAVALLPIVKEHEETIIAQKQLIADLQARLDRQEALLTKLTMGNPAFQNALENDGTLKAEVAPVKK